MQIYTETLTENLSVKLPQDLVAMLEVEPGDTVVFQVKGTHATISGLEMATIDEGSDGAEPFSKWSSAADEEAYRAL